MTAEFDILAVGNAIVDVIAPCEDALLEAHGLRKGAMNLIDGDFAARLYADMKPGLEASGGSAGNTVAGAASFGARCAFVGKVANDQLGEVFKHDLQAQGIAFTTPVLTSGPATARSLINVTSDSQRTMATFLGAANQLTPADIDPEQVRAANILYLEGYLFDPPPARATLDFAASIAAKAGRLTALTLSDVFVVERHRDELLRFLEARTEIVFANEAEVLALYPGLDFDAAAAELAQTVEIAAITRSERGSMVFGVDGAVEVPAFPAAQVLDTTGAGDQYAAGFLFGLSRGASLRRCAELGGLAAAEVISHYGARPQVALASLAAAAGLAVI